MAVRTRVDNRLALGLLVLSYVLLVLIVATGAFYVQHEFEDAKDDRCDILRVQVDLLKLQSQILDDQDPAVTLTPEMVVTLDKVKSDADRVCPLN